jgi:hypothetical protein
MRYLLLADLVLALHLAFIAFVTLGGWLLARYPRLVYLHLPAAAWGALIEFMGWICPLTPLEQQMRRRGGEAGYAGGFIEHYLTAVIYPQGLTREIQVGLGILVLVLNIFFYRRWWRARHRVAGHLVDHSAQARNRSV